MIVAPFKVLLDANVLFPFSLRDTLLRAAAEGFFQLYWSEEILDEVTRNLVAGTITDEQAKRLRTAMTGAFPESMVTGYEALIDAMPNQDKDRHVAAAAVKAGAQVVVTSNLKDFSVVRLVREQAKALRNPPRAFDELLRGLARQSRNSRSTWQTTRASS